MYIDAHSPGVSILYLVVDDVVQGMVTWINTETGEFCRYVKDSQGYKQVVKKLGSNYQIFYKP